MDLTKAIGRDPNFHIEFQALRERLGLSHREMGAKLGVHYQTIKNWEHPWEQSPYCTRPGFENRKKIAALIAANPQAQPKQPAQTQVSGFRVVSEQFMVEISQSEIDQANVDSLLTVQEILLDLNQRMAASFAASAKLQKALSKAIQAKTMRV